MHGAWMLSVDVERHRKSMSLALLLGKWNASLSRIGK
jgi:hypothetical protein